MSFWRGVKAKKKQKKQPLTLWCYPQRRSVAKEDPSAQEKKSIQ
jgi:hypothetical protein